MKRGEIDWMADSLCPKVRAVFNLGCVLDPGHLKSRRRAESGWFILTDCILPLLSPSVSSDFRTVDRT